MFEPRIKLESALYERLKKAAEARGYSSVDEFIVHVLESAAGEDADKASEDEVRKRLKGLGYLGE